MILLSVICIILLSLLILFIVLSVKASRRIERYEYFFRDTIVDIDHARHLFDQLVNKREYLADNPDIQQIQRVFAIVLEILSGYLNEGRQLSKNQKEKETEEEKE